MSGMADQLPLGVVHHILGIAFSEAKDNHVTQRQLYWSCAAVCRTWRSVALTLLLDDGHLPSADIATQAGHKPTVGRARPVVPSPPSLHHVFWHPLHMLLPQRPSSPDSSKSTSGLLRCLVTRQRLPGGLNSFTLYGNAEQGHGQRCFMLHAFQTSRIRPAYTLSLSHSQPKEAAFATLKADYVNRSHYTLQTLELSKHAWLQQWLASAGLMMDDKLNSTGILAKNSLALSTDSIPLGVPATNAAAVAAAGTSSASHVPFLMRALSNSHGEHPPSRTSSNGAPVPGVNPQGAVGSSGICLARMYPAQFTYGSGLPRRLDMQCLRPRRPCDGRKAVTTALFASRAAVSGNIGSCDITPKFTNSVPTTTSTIPDVPPWPSLGLEKPDPCSSSTCGAGNSSRELSRWPVVSSPALSVTTNTCSSSSPQRIVWRSNSAYVGDGGGTARFVRHSIGGIWGSSINAMAGGNQPPRTSSGGSVAMLGVPHRRLAHVSMAGRSSPVAAIDAGLPSGRVRPGHSKSPPVPTTIRWVKSIKSAFNRTFNLAPSTHKPAHPPNELAPNEHITALVGPAASTACAVVVARHSACGNASSHFSIPAGPTSASTSATVEAALPPATIIAARHSTGSLRRARSLPGSRADVQSIAMVLPDCAGAPAAQTSASSSSSTTQSTSPAPAPHMVTSMSGVALQPGQQGMPAPSSGSGIVSADDIHNASMGNDMVHHAFEHGAPGKRSSTGRPRLVRFTSKQPHWNTNMHAWCLNFGGRVRLPSARNFQLCMPEGAGSDHDASRVVLQFGKVGEDVFCLDWDVSLMSPVQALSSALTAFHRSWGLA